MTSNNPLVSVIIPVYNAEGYILETVESVINQTYKNIEIILIDHASTDGSSALIEQNFSNLVNVSVIKCPINAGGPALPRNKGIEASKGSFVAFLDADDVWLPNKLEDQITLMLAADINFSCTHAFLIDSQGLAVKPKIFPPRLPRMKAEVYGLKELVVKNTIITSTVVLRKDFLKSFRFNESVNVAFSEDYLLWMSLMNLDDCKFFHVQNDLIKYRCFNNSSSQAYGRTRMIIKSLYVISKFVLENKREDLFLRGAIAGVLKIINISAFDFVRKVFR